MSMYICEIFVCFRSHIFVCEPFEEKLMVLAGEARPDTIVEVRARFEPCILCGVNSKPFGPAGVDKTISPGFCMMPYFIFIQRTYRSLRFLHEHSPDAGQLSHALRRERTRQTQTRTAAVQRAYYNQLATMLHDVLYCSQWLLSDPGIRHRG